MSKRLSPAVVVALKGALCAVYCTRSFLQQCPANPAVQGSLTFLPSWNNTETGGHLNSEEKLFHLGNNVNSAF